MNYSINFKYLYFFILLETLVLEYFICVFATFKILLEGVCVSVSVWCEYISEQLKKKISNQIFGQLLLYIYMKIMDIIEGALDTL